MKRKLLFLMALAISAFTWNAKAQTDVTSTYLTNADFSSTTALTSTYLYGYGKDGSPYGLQDVDGWTKYVVSGDNSNANYPNSGMGGGVLSYNSSTQLKGGGKAAPANDPDGNLGNCLGYFAVWGCGGYYYQDVTLPAGDYTIKIPVYNQQGTKSTTTYFGFIPNSGTSQTIATPTTTGAWVTLTKSFTLTAETAGKICVGYKSNGNGSGDNPHLFIDKVQILYTAKVVKDVLANALTAANNANVSLNNSNLAAAITTAQAVYDNASATQDEVNAAAETLNNATMLAMSDAGDVTFLLSNPGFESCTETTTNAAAVGDASPLDISGEWTQTSSAGWSSSAVVAYNGSGQVNGVSAPSADNAGNGGKTLGVSVGWGGLITYKSQSVTLPAGSYKVIVHAYNNLENVTQFASKNGFVSTNGTSYLSTKNSFAYGEWVEDVITFTLNEATEGAIQIGGQAVSGGSGSNAKVFFDNIKIEYQSFLAAAKAAWQEAHDAAVNATENVDYDNISGAERTALNAEIAKAEPKTVEGCEEATAALIEATNTFTAAKPSYDELAAEIAYATTLEVPTTEAQTVLDSEETTATTAVTATEALKVLEYTTLKEGYTYDASAKLGDWTVTGFSSTTTGQHWNGQNTQYFDQWNGSAAEPSLIQSVTLPAGEYLFMAAGRGPSTSSLSMTVNETTVNFKMKGDTGKGIDTNGDANFGDGTYANNNNGRGWEWRYVIFTLNEETEVSFAINGNINNSWVSVTKEMNLYSKPSAALSKEVLAAVLEQANGVKDDAANVGDAAFQIPTATYNTFVDAIASGQAVYDNSSATTEQVDNAVTALENAIEAYNNAELNAPASGQVFNVMNVSEGYNHSGKAVTFKSASNADLTANTTSMGYNELPGSFYPQDITFTPVVDVINGYTLSYTRADGNTIYVGTGASTDLGSNHNQLRPTTDASKAVTIKIVATSTEGVWNLYNTFAERNIGANGADDQGFFTVDSYTSFNIQEAAKHDVSLKILAENQYGTIILPFDVAIPEGVVAYSATELNGSVIELTTVTEMKANTPYILFAESGAETTLSGYGAAYTDPSYTSGLLTGVYTLTAAPAGSYVLQKQNDKVAFYVVEEGTTINVPAYRAYLTAPEASGVKTLNFGPADDATGISAIEALTTGTAEIYNAAGVRVSKLEKGVNIIRTADGKTQKVLVK